MTNVRWPAFETVIVMTAKQLLLTTVCAQPGMYAYQFLLTTIFWRPAILNLARLSASCAYNARGPSQWTVERRCTLLEPGSKCNRSCKLTPSMVIHAGNENGHDQLQLQDRNAAVVATPISSENLTHSIFSL